MNLDTISKLSKKLFSWIFSHFWWFLFLLRLFYNSSLRKLLAGHNMLGRLPDRLERTQVEVLDVQHNQLLELPSNLLLKADRYNYKEIRSFWLACDEPCFVCYFLVQRVIWGSPNLKVAKPYVVRTDVCPTQQNTFLLFWFSFLLWLLLFSHQAPAEHLLLEI